MKSSVAWGGRMTSPVLAALTNARLAEQRQVVADREAKLAAEVYRIIGPPDHIPDAVMPVVFAQFCAKWGVPSLPARPISCAAFVLSHRGIDPAELVELVAAIGRAHLAADFADPTASSTVNAALARF